MIESREPAPDPKAAFAGAPFVVLLVISGGLNQFTANTLKSLRRVGVPPQSICLFCSAAAKPEIEPLFPVLGPSKLLVLEDVVESREPANGEAYSDYGTADFGRFTFNKWKAIQWLMEAGAKQVIYTDVDIAWRRNPIPLLLSIAKVFDVALQTECQPTFPPHFCTGFMSLRNSPFTHALLQSLVKVHMTMLKAKPEIHDQQVFNALVSRNLKLMKNIFPLSEAVFPNGLLARFFTRQDPELGKLFDARIQHAIFHANFTVGLDNKRKMLEITGNWLP
ncbi:MAG: hypothetical protein HYU77_04070 [Betaproteobacteria bacterium]|nr:hypothetical protein [Betaproteobacteria bacterium]